MANPLVTAMANALPIVDRVAAGALRALERSKPGFGAAYVAPAAAALTCTPARALAYFTGAAGALLMFVLGLKWMCSVVAVAVPFYATCVALESGSAARERDLLQFWVRGAAAAATAAATAATAATATATTTTTTTTATPPDQLSLPASQVLFSVWTTFEETYLGGWVLGWIPLYNPLKVAGVVFATHPAFRASGPAYAAARHSLIGALAGAGIDHGLATGGGAAAAGAPRAAAAKRESTLTVQLFRARGLDSESSAYCELVVQAPPGQGYQGCEGSRYKSRVKVMTKSPVWNQTFDMKVRTLSPLRVLL
jgi:hypothetical protein